jgi:LDH2 family malate/lactate/ureidoglycolate dehydrogenase
VTRVAVASLHAFASSLLIAAGLEARHADCFARRLIAGDLFGHTSHGIRLLPRYLDEIGDGHMTCSGDPELVATRGATLLFDGRMLPGPVVMTHAIEAALARLGTLGSAIVVIRRSTHIAALCAYLEIATERGAMMLIASSNPWARLVAPFGGQRAAYSPNPIAFGVPTSGDPILIDFSTASIAANVVEQHRARGEALPGAHLIDADGRATRDPNALRGERPGAILPLGGLELGHKGFGLGLMVEALTAGLGGYGRSDAPAATNNAVFILVIDPNALGGATFLRREMDALVASCRAAADAAGAVVMPGERALAHRRCALAQGLEIASPLRAELDRRATALGVATLGD